MKIFDRKTANIYDNELTTFYLSIRLIFWINIK